MKTSVATDNSLFPSCRGSAGAFPSPVKCLGTLFLYLSIFIQECSSTGHPSCLPWPSWGIYSMAGQGTPRWMWRYFSFLEDSPSLRRSPRFVLDQAQIPHSAPNTLQCEQQDLTPTEPGPRHSLFVLKSVLKHLSKNTEKNKNYHVLGYSNSTKRIPSRNVVLPAQYWSLRISSSMIQDYNWNSLF